MELANMECIGPSLRIGNFCSWAAPNLNQIKLRFELEALSSGACFIYGSAGVGFSILSKLQSWNLLLFKISTYM